MYRGARATIALIAATVSAVALAVPARAAGPGSHSATTKPPTLSSYSTILRRGTYTVIHGGYLQPNTAYQISTDGGRFGTLGSSTTITSGSTGTFDISYELTGDVTANSVTISLTVPGTGELVASMAITVDLPSIDPNRKACPGVLEQLDGLGFLDGNYRLSTTAGSFLAGQTTTASNGRLDPVPQFRLPVDPPHQITVTVTRADSGAIVLTDVETLATPLAHASYQSPWQRLVIADCFRPYELVQVRTASQVTAAASVAASVFGTITLPMVLHPGSQPSAMTSYGQLTGTQSGQSADLADPANAPVPATTLLAGQSLTDALPATPARSQLATATPGYTFKLIQGTANLSTWTPSGREIILWSTDQSYWPWQGSTLTLRADGNLVIALSNGKLRWQTGTAGTGTANRLVLQQNGNLVLSTSTGALVWSTDTGPVRNAQGLLSYAYLASSRYRSAVYVNGLVHQRSSTGQLIASAGRTVYLQRYLNGHWQNVLVRTTASHGQLSVGFIQSTVYQYRLLVLPTAGTSGTASASNVR